MGDDDPVRVDAIDIESHGHRRRVLVDEPDARAVLGAAFADVRIDEPSPVEFVVRAPQGTSKFYLVLDRTGFVLGRTRTVEEALTIVSRHLVAQAPPAPGSIRCRFRTVLTGDGRAVIAGFPLFTEPAPIERRLQRERSALVDQLHVDLSVTDGRIRAVPPSSANPFDGVETLGHAPLPDGGVDVRGLLLPGGASPSRAEAVLQVLQSYADLSGDRSLLLERAEQIASLPTIGVTDRTRHDRYDALKR